MRFIDFDLNDKENRLTVKSNSGFAVPISILNILKVADIIDEVLNGRVAKQLFEGLTHIEISTTKISMIFMFSIDEQHMLEVEKRIGRKELTSHRLNFIMYVYAKIDEQFKLDDTLPMGFQDNLNMPQYIR